MNGKAKPIESDHEPSESLLRKMIASGKSVTSKASTK
jgi:hypothetical protein